MANPHPNKTEANRAAALRNYPEPASVYGQQALVNGWRGLWAAAIPVELHQVAHETLAGMTVVEAFAYSGAAVPAAYCALSAIDNAIRAFRRHRATGEQMLPPTLAVGYEYAEGPQAPLDQIPESTPPAGSTLPVYASRGNVLVPGSLT